MNEMTMAGALARQVPEAAWADRAFAALVDECFDAVFRYLWAMTDDAATAEDLTQDVFLKAYRERARLRDPESARSWVFAIAVNTLRSHVRRRSRFRWFGLHEGDAAVPPAATTRDPRPDSDRRLMVREGLRALDQDDRDVLLLVGLFGFTASETAELLGIGVAAAQKRWQRACARFRRAVEEVER